MVLLEIHILLSIRKKFNNLAEHCQKYQQEFSKAEGFLKIKNYPHMLSSPILVIKHEALLPNLPEL